MGYIDNIKFPKFDIANKIEFALALVKSKLLSAKYKIVT